MTAWTLAVLGLLPPLVVATLAAGRGASAARMIAAQMASTVGILLAVALTFAEDQPSGIDLPLTLVLLAVPATLLYALFEERWL